MRLGSWFKASRSASTSRQRGIAPLRRDDGEGYRELLTRMAQESGIETPTAEDLPRVDRKWKGKTPPNADWKNRPIRKRRICVKGLGLQPRAIKPRRRAPAAERLQSLSRVVVGDGDQWRCTLACSANFAFRQAARSSDSRSGTMAEPTALR
jgi:hypothetical protein